MKERRENYLKGEWSPVGDQDVMEEDKEDQNEDQGEDQDQS